MPELEITIRGIDQLELRLERIQEALEPAEVLVDASELLLFRILERYSQQVDPDGQSWPPSLAALREGRPTLVDTGDLLASIDIDYRSDTEAAIFTDVPYGRYHQEGTRRMPRRRFLGFSSEDATLVERLIKRKIDRIKR